ncbi:MAG: hypothetical protein NTX59_04435 [Elusimicrobia bacterium]|nr:hypothetical protein [Elusimicrobiota bacterium]
MKIVFLTLVLYVCPPLAGAYDLPSSTGTHHMDFSADEGQFNEYTRVINLKGNASLKEISSEGKTLKIMRAVEMSVNMASRTAVSPGDFVMDDDTGTIYGKSGVFDYGADSGFVTDGRLAYKNFIFRGSRIEFNERRYLYRKASLTSCDEEPPHYRIRASRIYLVPNRYFLAYNTVFFLGRVPIFYFPVLYRPFGSSGTPFAGNFRPGYDERNGVYVKSTFVYKFNPNLSGRLFLDYFAKKGFGTGGEADYRKPEKNISNLSVYRIRETGSKLDRWGASGGYWHSFNRFSESDPARYYSQSSFRLLSDPDFNNDFFRNNPFAVSPDKQASLAFTRQSNYTLTRLSISEHYVRSADLKSFIKDSESAPRLDFNTVPFKVGPLPVLNSFTGDFENALDTGTNQYQRRGRGVWTMSKPVPFSKHIILSPSVFYDQSLFIATSAVMADQWIGRYGSNVNLRYDSLWGAFDFKYSYLRRMKVNRLGPDSKAADKGEEIKSISPELFIMPRRDIYFKSQTSYDLRDSSHSVFSQRLSPLISELYYSPRQGLDIYLEDSYIFGNGNRSFIAQINVGDEKNYSHSGLANYNSDPSVYILNQTFGFKPRPDSSWRVEGVLRFKTVPAGFIRFSEFIFFEKSLIVYKDFHDFRTKWEVRTRTGAKEFYFLISLKMNDHAAKDDLDADSRKFWHPWRKEGEVRD